MPALAAGLVLVAGVLPLAPLPPKGGTVRLLLAGDLVRRELASALVVLAPLLAAALLLFTLGPRRRLAMTVSVVLAVYSLGGLWVELTRAMILVRIKTPVWPPPEMWSLRMVGPGAWALALADLLLLMAAARSLLWGTRTRRVS